MCPRGVRRARTRCSGSPAPAGIAPVKIMIDHLRRPMNAFRLKSRDGIGPLGLTIQPVAIQCARAHILGLREKISAAPVAPSAPFARRGLSTCTSTFSAFGAHTRKLHHSCRSRTRPRRYLKWRCHLRVQPFTGATESAGLMRREAAKFPPAECRPRRADC